MAKTPYGASALIDLRGNGVVPELPVLVSLVGKLGFSNLTLQAKAAERYDWRAIAALDVEVFASAAVSFASLLQTLADIAAAVPKHLVLTFVEGPRVDCGDMRTLQDFALFDWFPMAIGPNAYREGCIIARKLWDALGHELPIPYDEACSLLPQALKEQQQCA